MLGSSQLVDSEEGMKSMELVIHNLHSSPGFVRMIKSNTLKCCSMQQAWKRET
jgi:hypothetical protein